ncbi:hypothetical protein CTI12_AA007160 [Artemisia annua]|uniref:40S ribosomal protein S8 n=1 Tax=Artemisia annua TaxID=35608 RepID=A0A2U1QHL1_ARTAN|nr:hypothetical protein CTI12_AA007160 [Artemisia annua]
MIGKLTIPITQNQNWYVDLQRCVNGMRKLASQHQISSNKTVRRVRVRGGNVKGRALRLDTGNFSWGSEVVTRKTRILDVVYNASNNELVRTQTLVKGAIVQVDAAPYKQWYLQHYDKDLSRKKKAVAGATKKEGEEAEAAPEEAKNSNHVVRKIEKRQEECKLDPYVEKQFSGCRLLAAISSRPGQCSRTINEYIQCNYQRRETTPRCNAAYRRPTHFIYIIFIPIIDNSLNFKRKRITRSNMKSLSL